MRLGAFELVGPLARGGMGTVWNARHVRTGLPVAVKLIHFEQAATPAARRGFAREVRTAAALDHPAIVWVLDHGIVSEPGHADVAVGSPWLAMERARQTLLDTVSWADWSTLKGVLIGVLDALAFLHARDLCHRDVKPENVLDVDGTWKLADFGLTHALAAGGEGGAAGTPLYMPPEQIRGAWRDLGPHTDLYALGATVWHLVTGRPPFEDADIQALLRAHLHREPAAFMPRMAVPNALEEWVRTCLEKAPEDRFRCAAEAAEALTALGGKVVEATEGTRHDGRPHTFVLSAVLEAPPAVTAPADPRTPRPGPRGLPPAWRRPTRVPSPAIRDAGLALLRFRRPQPTGRELEKQALWEALRAATDGPASVGLVGPIGSGRSTLTAWLCERARELAPVPVAAVQGDGTADDILIDVLEAVTGARGADRPTLAARLSRVCPEAAPEVIEALRPTGLPRDVASALRTLIRGLGRGPAVVAPAGPVPAATELLDRLHRASVPCLLVLQAPSEAELPPSLGAVLRLKGMQDEALVRAIEALLPLEENAVQVLVARAGGHPGRMRAELAAWVERGDLSPGPDGFRLSAIPPRVEDDSELDALPPGDLAVLQGAAVLAGQVPIVAWRAACAAMEIPLECLDMLVRDGLVAEAPDGAHVTVRGADRILGLRDRARRDGTLERWRCAWSEALRTAAQTCRDAGDTLGGLNALRRARVLVRDRADIHEGAVRHALAVQLTMVGRLDEALLEVGAALEIRRALGLGGAEAASLLLLGAIYERQGRVDDGEAAVRAAVGIEGASERTIAIAWGNLGELEIRRGRPEVAEPLLRKALDAWREIGSPAGVATCLSNLGILASMSGRHEDALALHQQAMELFEGHAADHAILRTRRANVLRELGRDAEAERAQLELYAWCIERGLVVVASSVCTNLGNIYVRTGRLQEARVCYERAVTATRDRGASDELTIACVNLATVRRMLGDLTGATEALDEAVRLAGSMGSRVVEAQAITEQAHVSLEQGRSREALRRVDRARAQLGDTASEEQLEHLRWIRASASLLEQDMETAAAVLARAEASADASQRALEHDWDHVRQTLKGAGASGSG